VTGAVNGGERGTSPADGKNSPGRKSSMWEWVNEQSLNEKKRKGGGRKKSRTNTPRETEGRILCATAPGIS